MKDNHSKPIDRDDPRLTAYVLGEVTAEVRAEIEAALAADASLAEEVESIRQTVDLLQTSLAAEPLPEEPVKVRTQKQWYQRRLPQLGILAASVCLLLVLILPALEAPRECARQTAILNDTSESQLIASAPAEPAATSAKPRDRAKLKDADVKTDKIPESQTPSGFWETIKTVDESSIPLEDRKPIVKPKSEESKETTLGMSAPGVSSATLDTQAQTKPARKPHTLSVKRKERLAGTVPASSSPPAYGFSPKKWAYGTKSKVAKGSKPTKGTGAGMGGGMMGGGMGGMGGTVGQPNGIYSGDLDVPFQAFGRKIEEEKTAGTGAGMGGGMMGRDMVSGKPLKSYSKAIDNWRKIQKQESQQVRGGESEAEAQAREQIYRFQQEAYDQIVENEFLRTTEQPLSTFSIDVDTAGYSNLRRFLNQGSLPPKGLVRTEEMVNYFEYEYSPPTAEDKTPFAAHLAVAKCPWNKKHELVRIALKGRVVEEESRPSMNLVFLLDVSGSMSDANKLPLVKEGMTRLVRQLKEKDRVAIVVYAGASGLVLPSTAADEDGKPKILAALDRLNSGGSTNGGDGIRLAYATAAKHFNNRGVNRVILCTDGDFNVGTTSQSELVDLIEKKAKEDVFLTVLGFGCGNYKDSTLEKLADKGNGNYGYIDTLAEAEKLLVRQLLGTLVTIAKDVKIQVEFNPTKVAAYRLLGYENRVMAKEDFNDDTKDAGEIGAGHTFTAFYELVPVGADESVTRPSVDPLKYQPKPKKEPPAVRGEPATAGRGSLSDELLTLKLRYKEPDGDTSTKVEFPLVAPKKLPAFAEADTDFQFAGSVVGFAMLLRDSKYKGTVNFKNLIEWAEEARGSDPHGYRSEFIQLLRAARSMSNE